MRQFSEKLYLELRDELEDVLTKEQNPTKRLTSTLLIIKNKIKTLREFVQSKAFSSKEDEIYFFKYIKPRFYSLLIYESALFTLKNNRPVTGLEKIKAYYIQEIKFIDRFFRQHSFHYEYYRLGAQDLDDIYFIRGENSGSILIPEIPDPDPSFSTSCDYLFAQMKAMEMLKDKLIKMIDNLSPQTDSLGEPVAEMKWTGDKVNLAEVIYGIYFTGQINNGKTELSTLIKWLGRVFQIDLKRIYSDYKDIRNRKIASPTRYLDQMRTAMHQRIDDENAFKPTSILVKK
ncbi:MAG: RteC domain-containing protein [Bacteroidota bacterium]